MSVLTLQRNLQRLGLYLGQIDGNPRNLTCDALVRFLAGPHAPVAGQPLAQALPVRWWDTPQLINTVLAQVMAECAFAPKAENLSYTAERLAQVWPARFDPEHGGTLDPHAYAGRPEALAALVYNGRNGNRDPGDGFRFRGRGWPQLTGRSNYLAFSAPCGVDLIANPDALLRLDVSALATVAYVRLTPGLLAACIAGNVAEARHLWNGGLNGLADAQAAFDKLQLLWGIAH